MDPFTGLPTLRHDLSIDRGMSFEAAAARLAHERSGAPAAVRRMGAAEGRLVIPTSAASPLHNSAP